MTKYGDNLIVSLVAIQHAEATDRTNIYDDITVCNITLGEYANIEWVAVTNDVGAVGLLHTILRYALAAETLRNKAVKGRNNIRILLRTVDADVAAHLVHGSSDDRFSITYATRKISEEEIRSVGFDWMDYSEAVSKYDPKALRDGFNTLEDGEEIFYISNPALGLWADRAKF